jgi:hypothetical protein
MVRAASTRRYTSRGIGPSETLRFRANVAVMAAATNYIECRALPMTTMDRSDIASVREHIFERAFTITRQITEGAEEAGRKAAEVRRCCDRSREVRGDTPQSSIAQP